MQVNIYMRILLLSFASIIITFQSTAQFIDPASIDIVRDSFSVLAYFSPIKMRKLRMDWRMHMRKMILKPCNWVSSPENQCWDCIKVKPGARIDYIAHLLRCRQTAAEKYESGIGEDFKRSYPVTARVLMPMPEHILMKYLLRNYTR